MISTCRVRVDDISCAYKDSTKNNRVVSYITGLFAKATDKQAIITQKIKNMKSTMAHLKTAKNRFGDFEKAKKKINRNKLDNMVVLSQENLDSNLSESRQQYRNNIIDIERAEFSPLLKIESAIQLVQVYIALISDHY